MEKQIIEVNGIKMEVDMRHARRVDHIVVGTKVKVLVKGSYGEPEVHTGAVVGFEQFQTMPTIIVCYLKVDYSSCELKFAYINAKSADKYEIVVSIDDELPIQKQDVLSRIDREIEKKRGEIEDMDRKRAYFLTHFNTYFEAAAASN
jgi:hypothetical protein